MMNMPIIKRHSGWVRVRGTALVYHAGRNVLVLPRSLPVPKLAPPRPLFGGGA
jgi:hypothetical protein